MQLIEILRRRFREFLGRRAVERHARRYADAGDQRPEMGFGDWLDGFEGVDEKLRKNASADEKEKLAAQKYRHAQTRLFRSSFADFMSLTVEPLFSRVAGAVPETIVERDFPETGCLALLHRRENYIGLGFGASDSDLEVLAWRLARNGKALIERYPWHDEKLLIEVSEVERLIRQVFEMSIGFRMAAR